MPANQHIQVGLLKRDEVEEADRILRLAFGTFLGVANPVDFMGDRHFLTPRWRSSHVKVLAARDDGRLIGSKRRHALGIFRIPRPPDGVAGVLGAWSGPAAARSHDGNFRAMGRTAYRAVYLRTKAPGTRPCTKSSATGHAISPPS